MIFEEQFYGKYFFQVAMLLRNSLILSTLLTNTEAWPNLTSENIRELEKKDEDYLRYILKSPRNSSKASLYLTLGVQPISYIIRQRRLSFLHYILNEEDSSAIKMVLIAQIDKPSKNKGTIEV